MEDLVELGRLSGAYGFRGWVRVVPFDSGEVLEKVRRWVLISPSGETTPVEAKGVRRHGGGLIAKWDGCESKEAADALRGRVAVARADFPAAGDDAVWAVDLLECRVVNREGVDLGRIVDIGTNGVQDLLVVAYAAEDGRECRFMIPNVKEVYVLSIDVEARIVTVDWSPEWR